MRRHRIASVLGVMAALCVMSGCGQADGYSETVTFERVRGVPLVEVYVGERGPLTMLIDTGVDPSVIDERVADQIGVAVDGTEVGEASGSGDGEGLEVKRAPLRDLHLGDLALGNVDALAADLQPFSQMMGRELHGILGYSALKGRVVRIDYPASEMTWASGQDQLPPPATATTERAAFALVFNSDTDMIPVAEVFVHGEPVVVSLDTGRSGGLDIWPAAAERVGVTPDDLKGGASVERLGARGQSQALAGTLDEIAIGPFVVRDAAASLSDRQPDDGVREGNAGNAVLDRFVITFDYVAGELVVGR